MKGSHLYISILLLMASSACKQEVVDAPIVDEATAPKEVMEESKTIEQAADEAVKLIEEDQRAEISDKVSAAVEK
jgi:hypothetical protein